MYESLITQELIEKTYGFCYKRLSNSEDAQDVAQEILCEALKALHSGKPILDFPSWYWAMARNRFYQHLKLKKNGAVPLESVACIGEPEAPQEPELDEEEISKLNYAISRLSELHRSVIILYYLKQKKIREISEALQVPEGTVKRRLFDAKQSIKEDMNQMEQIGTGAYAPAEVILHGSRGAPQYWQRLNDVIVKQIFASTAFSPKTVKEISEEICVAPVYFEDRIGYLLEHQFIKETSPGKYITDFCIYPKQVWTDCSAAVGELYAKLGKEVTELLREHQEEIRSFSFIGNDLPFEKLLWWLYYYVSCALGNALRKKEDRYNGKPYDLAGKVLFPDEVYTPKDTGAVSWSNLHQTFRTASYSWIQYANLYEIEPFPDRDHILHSENIDLFMRIVENPSLPLNPIEEEMAAELIRKGYLEKRGDGLYPTMLVMPWSTHCDLSSYIQELLKGIAEKYVPEVRKTLDVYLLPHTRKDLISEYKGFITDCYTYSIEYLFGYAFREKTLYLPDSYENSSLATSIYYRK